MDASIRANDVQYVVWDTFSAQRTSFFTSKLLGYVRRYNGRVVHTQSIELATSLGNRVRKPVMVVYAVRLDRGMSPPEVFDTVPGTLWEKERGLDERQYIIPGGGGFGEIMNNAYV